ncbi:AAA family ATPase [Phenylobacterium sp.]|uniref:AAA family ATPase n=1 Tax=Phenylobacterium sp. TaxID=1871053 RepID=UPI002E351BF9|nr:AAA family ATPase [Phenylobacterium sp.]HEX4712751.1 AAA family ATPase [Phenylobacterium sp.]
MVEIGYTDAAGGALNRARLFPIPQLDQAAHYAAGLNRTPGVNIYAGAALRRPGADRYKRARAVDVLGANALWFDADRDAETVLAKCAELDVSPPVVVQTGTRPALRLHGWWPLDSLLADPAALSAQLRAIAAALGTDAAVSDPPRVLRLAGCIAWPKKGGRVPELVTLRRDRTAAPCISVQELARAFPPAQGVASRETGAGSPAPGSLLGAFIVRDLQSALASMPSDDRELWVRMGHALKPLGEPGRALWLEWSQTSDKFDPVAAADAWESFQPDRTGYQAVFAEAQRRGWINPSATAQGPAVGAGQQQEATAEPRSPALLRASDLLARPLKPRPWLVPDMIPAGQVTELRGDGGAGKSTLALQLCAAAVTGRNWLDMPVACGPAINLASEDDEDELRRRLDAIAVHLGVSNADLFNLHLWPLAADDPALMTLGKGGIELTRRFDELARHMAEIKPAVVVLDSRADVFAGEEMNRNQVRGFIGALRKLALTTGAAVVNLAHPSLSGMANKSGNSGSTHWGNAVRSALYLRPEDREEQSDPNARVLEVVKNNYAAGGLSLKLRWSAGAFVPADGGRPKAASFAEAAAKTDQIFMKLLAQFEAQGRVVNDKPGSNYAPNAFAKDPGREGIKSKGFQEAMYRLFAAQRLRVIDIGKPSRATWKLIAVGDGAG